MHENDYHSDDARLTLSVATFLVTLVLLRIMKGRSEVRILLRLLHL